LEVAAGLVEDGVVGYDADPVETTALPEAFRRDATCCARSLMARTDWETRPRILDEKASWRA
jgi:hypothetical protein